MQRPTLRSCLMLTGAASACRDSDHKRGKSLSRLLKNSILVLPLGGAAVYRCDKLPIFSAGFSR